MNLLKKTAKKLLDDIARLNIYTSLQQIGTRPFTYIILLDWH